MGVESSGSTAVVLPYVSSKDDDVVQNGWCLSVELWFALIS